MDPWWTPDRTGFAGDLMPSNTAICSYDVVLKKLKLSTINRILNK